MQRSESECLITRLNIHHIVLPIYSYRYSQRIITRSRGVFQSMITFFKSMKKYIYVYLSDEVQQSFHKSYPAFLKFQYTFYTKSRGLVESISDTRSYGSWLDFRTRVHELYLINTLLSCRPITNEFSSNTKEEPYQFTSDNLEVWMSEKQKVRDGTCDYMGIYRHLTYSKSVNRRYAMEIFVSFKKYELDLITIEVVTGKYPKLHVKRNQILQRLTCT